MDTVNIHDAKTNLSKLVERSVQRGEPFVIARAGKPLVKVVPLDQAAGPKPRIGFLRGRIRAPDDFDSRHTEAIAELFEGE